MVSLDIGIGDRRSIVPLGDEPRLALEDDGYYRFLFPMIEALAEETGRYIDMYGDASFQGESLVALGRFLSSAAALVESQPETWEVHVGMQTHPEREELYRTVERGHLLDLLARWRAVVARAGESNRPVICFGD